jgi:ribosomal protein L29
MHLSLSTHSKFTSKFHLNAHIRLSTTSPASLKMVSCIDQKFYQHKLTVLSQSSSKVKTGQLWSKNKDDLKKQLDELKTELGTLRVQKIAGGAASKLTKMYATPIACI